LISCLLWLNLNKVFSIAANAAVKDGATMNGLEDAPGPDGAASKLNEACLCRTLDKPALAAALARELEGDELLERRPHLFSNVAVFISHRDAAAMQATVSAIERLAKTPSYIEAALAWAAPIAGRDFGPRGMLMGYDFHLGANGPTLIEVNTNAGGAFLNAALARAQRACCAEAQTTMAPSEDFEEAFIAMVEAEWRTQRGGGRPATVAIVDDEPAQQHLYPEFVIASRMLERHGIETIIADPRSLALDSGRLQSNGRPVDFVYNRLVDFSLAEDHHSVLRDAYVDDLAVISPNPRVHALFADKRNLTLLSDADLLRSWSTPEREIEALAAVPVTRRISTTNAESLWRERKHWFFKPAQGYASKAAYRGDKITTRVWKDILSAEYVAQTFAPPSSRAITLDGVRAEHKADVRLYTYDGEVLLAAARLYQGQTTNLRTPGGGFAPVFIV